MALIVGADIGGTFADFAAIDTESGTITTLKVLTTPSAPGRDIALGLRQLAESGVALDEISRFVHGTTVGVNTIIQRVGARVALFTTAGFTDILELARLRRAHECRGRNVGRTDGAEYRQRGGKCESRPL
jgi:N-methylhydantoinase A